jgi:chromosome segregation ATPase
MAELLGLVAGVINVTQLAGQVSVSVFKLRKLWNEVKDVPETITSLMKQLELLNPILSEIEKQVPQIQAAIPTDRLGVLSLNHSRQAAQNLEQLVDDLQKQITSTKRLKKGIIMAKVVIRKEVIRAYQERLQNALQLLSLSQQTHLMWVLSPIKPIVLCLPS